MEFIVWNIQTGDPDSNVWYDSYSDDTPVAELTSEMPVSIDTAGNVVIDQERFADWWCQGSEMHGPCAVRGTVQRVWRGLSSEPVVFAEAEVDSETTVPEETRYTHWSEALGDIQDLMGSDADQRDAEVMADVLTERGYLRRTAEGWVIDALDDWDWAECVTEALRITDACRLVEARLREASR